MVAPQRIRPADSPQAADTGDVRPPRRGAVPHSNGVTFSVYAGHADAVDLCLFDAADGSERRIACQDIGSGVWAVDVPGIGPGTRYGFRARGPWEPRQGQRYNEAKLLQDPYARAITGEVTWRPAVFGHRVDETFAGDADRKDSRDSAAFVPRSVVIDEAFEWGRDAPPAVAMRDTVIYELHVAGFTKLLTDVPAQLRGTYAGLAHPAAISHLVALGVTTVELLPVHAFVDEPHLVKLGLSNYWGYNTLGFFAPHAAYASTDDPQGVVDEFKAMVKALHAAGIEVVLDVVYNHTCEQAGTEGATLCLRGLDNRIAYRLDEAGHDIDVTGCGNSVDARHPATMQLILDSLRYWVEQMHIDGFRFDLAVTLARGPADDFNPNDALLMALRTDPVLSRVKLIAEPWDVGMHGWRTGQFPPPMSEWNDRFRNTVRDFWLTDAGRSHRYAPADQTRGDHTDAGPLHGVADLATRLAGSQDLFDTPFRRPQASVNFITAHDGFTLADLVSYQGKHNEENGEDNRDGTTDNRSWNHGVEGPSDDADITAHRFRTMRSMLATLLLSHGVPMLTAGDEFARTQHGNNNAYCQDSPIGWVNWEHSSAQRDLMDTVRFLTEFRAAHPVLRPTTFFSATESSQRPTLSWFTDLGSTPTSQDWNEGSRLTLQALWQPAPQSASQIDHTREEHLDEPPVPATGPGEGSHDSGVLAIFHAGAEPLSVTLPVIQGVSAWDLVWDGSYDRPGDVPSRQVKPGDTYDVAGGSAVILVPQAG